MEKHRVPTDATKPGTKHLPASELKRDRDVVKMAQFILTHSTEISSETAYELLTVASKRRK